MYGGRRATADIHELHYTPLNGNRIAVWLITWADRGKKQAAAHFVFLLWSGLGQIELTFEDLQIGRKTEGIIMRVLHMQ